MSCGACFRSQDVSVLEICPALDGVASALRLEDGTLRVWDIRRGVRDADGAPKDVTSIVEDGYGAVLAVGKGGAHRMGADSKWATLVDSQPCAAVRPSPNGRYLAIAHAMKPLELRPARGTRGQTVELYRVDDNGKCVREVFINAALAAP